MIAVPLNKTLLRGPLIQGVAPTLVFFVVLPVGIIGFLIALALVAANAVNPLTMVLAFIVPIGLHIVIAIIGQLYPHGFALFFKRCDKKFGKRRYPKVLNP